MRLVDEIGACDKDMVPQERNKVLLKFRDWEKGMKNLFRVCSSLYAVSYRHSELNRWKKAA